MSCAAPGDCAAGGFYTDTAGHSQAFVASQTGGTWGTAIEVPGTAALNKGGKAQVLSVSCAAVGDCVAGGQYTDTAKHAQAFVVSEASGTWGTAIEVPGTAALNSGGNAQLPSVSCPAVGDCVAGGQYTDAAKHAQAFVVSEASGTWGAAIEVPGTAALNTGGDGFTAAVACPSPGNCLAGGAYTAFVSSEGADLLQPFDAIETGGVWGKAVEVPGVATLSQGVGGFVTSVSCASVGNCAVAGSYDTQVAQGLPFVASQIGGTWHSAQKINGGGVANLTDITQVSCPAAGDCVAGAYNGTFGRNNSFLQSLVATETGGKWGSFSILSGGTAEGTGLPTLNSVSCPAVGDCVAGGYFTEGIAGTPAEAYVATDSGGKWGAATEVPGIGTLNAGDFAEVTSVSCAAVGSCLAGGSYLDGAKHTQAFVVSETS